MEKSRWTKEKLAESIARYKRENGKYPTWREIDKCSYLPCTRTIQRMAGGLVKLRTIMGIENPNYGTGGKRIEMSAKINKRSREVENQVEKTLINRFGESFVHTEKPISNNSKSRYDFVVYVDGNQKIGIDVFYSEEIHDISKNVYMKLRNSYKNVVIPTYFVLANPEFAQSQLNSSMRKMKTKLPDLISLISWNEFLSLVSKGFKEKTDKSS